MASFKLEGLNELEEALLRREQQITETVPEMLEAGAEVLVKAQKTAVRRHFKGERSIGTLADSIKATQVKKLSSGGVIYVHPHGNQPHGTPKKGKKGKVPNAQVGFTLEYGSRNMPARPWMSEANEKSAGEVEEAMWKVWKDKQDG